MPNGVFQWLTLSNAISQLAQRLADPTNQFWNQDELQIYLQTALRQFNSLCWYWRVDFQYSDPLNLWNSLGSLSGSPRLRTITDTEIYTELEYMLLEPPSGGTWTGTTQFTISDLSQALQRRRDEMIQVGNLNQNLVSGIALTPNTIQTYLPDNSIDVERVRYMPVVASANGSAGSGTQTIAISSVSGLIATGLVISGAGINYWSTVTAVGSGSITISLPTTGTVSGLLNFSLPNTLYRDDTVANEFYNAPLYELSAGTPQTFSLSSEPPLSWNVDVPPNLPGTYEAIVLQSGAPFNPPTPTLIGIPDDLAWVLEWGVLADLLGRQSEATDNERAEYAMRRYQDGLTLMLKTPWIELGKINGSAVSIDSIVAMDRFSCEWDSNPTGFGPVIVAGGIDFVAGPVGSGLGMTVLGSAPFLDSTNTFVQVSRSDWEIVISLAQVRASWKMGGAEFKAALAMEKEAITACAAENVRLKSMGNYSDILDQRGLQQERDQNRYNAAHAKG